MLPANGTHKMQPTGTRGISAELRQHLAGWRPLKWVVLPAVLVFWGVTVHLCWRSLANLADAGVVERNSESLALALIVTVCYVHFWVGIVVLWLGFSRSRATGFETLVGELLSTDTTPNASDMRSKDPAGKAT